MTQKKHKNWTWTWFS